MQSDRRPDYGHGRGATTAAAHRLEHLQDCCQADMDWRGRRDGRSCRDREGCQRIQGAGGEADGNAEAAGASVGNLTLCYAVGTYACGAVSGCAVRVAPAPFRLPAL